MKIEERWKNGLGNIKTIIYGRTFIILVGFLLQLVFLIEGYIVLRKYSFLFYVLFGIIGVLAFIYIFNQRSSPDMKLAWMVPIAMFPIFGAVFYTTILFQPGAKRLRGRLEKLSVQTEDAIAKNADVLHKLHQESPHMAQLGYYLLKQDNSPVFGHTSVKYYPLGDYQFPDMLEALKQAKRFIFLEFFIVSDGRVWNSIHDILMDKAKAGVEVRLMYDGTDVLFNLPNYYPRILESEGIQCRMFSPIRPIFSSHYNNRDHRKILVIDGHTAFTGGINLADEYINEKERFGHWKDTGVRLIGEAVERFTYMFLEMWNAEARSSESFGAYAYERDVYEESDGYVIPYSSSPLGDERVGESVYLDIINTAHTYVHIMTPYLILDDRMLTALCYAAKRGVEVVILMPHIPDKKYAFALAKTYYGPLLQAGVRICEYGPGFVHAKVFVADGVKAVVGTVNLDYRSLYHHFECGVVLYRNSQIAAIEQDFQETVGKSIEQTEEMLEHRPLSQKIIGWIMRIIAPLM